jgi:hypothetical protein
MGVDEDPQESWPGISDLGLVPESEIRPMEPWFLRIDPSFHNEKDEELAALG